MKDQNPPDPPTEEESVCCVRRVLTRLYRMHMPTNFADIFEATIEGRHPPCPIFFPEHEAKRCVEVPSLRVSILKGVADCFPDIEQTYLYLVRQYEARGTTAQKIEFLMELIKAVRQRTNVLAFGKLSIKRSSLAELELVCEGKLPPLALVHLEQAQQSQRRPGHRTNRI